MCTLSWFTTETGYELFFNRDERLSRKRAQPPAVVEEAGVRYLAPTDADAGGTWIAVNQFGLTVCLLNHYQFEQIATYQDWTSRGAIVRQFAKMLDPASVAQHFQRMELSNYRAFRMFCIDLKGHHRLCVWDGHEPRVERSVSAPKSSSSVDARHVKELRKSLFTECGLEGSTTSADYIAFHQSHVPAQSKESVCMHREDARTVSLSHLRVSSSQAEFAYADGPPCQAPLSAPVILPITGLVLQGRTSAANF